MNIKKQAAALFLSLAAGSGGLGVFAASPSTYPEFVTNTLVPWIGICDTAKKLASDQKVGSAYPGIISASRADLDGDGAEELIVVEERRICVYGMGQNGIDLWDTLDTDLISDADTSYSNVFFYTVQAELPKRYLGIEKAESSGTDREYMLDIVSLVNAKFTSEVKLRRSMGAASLLEDVSAEGASVYSRQEDTELTTTYNPEGYPGIFAAAQKVLQDAGITPPQFAFGQDRLWFHETEEQIQELTGLTADELDALKTGKSARITEKLPGAKGITYSTTSGVGTDKQKVLIEDQSELAKLADWKKGITVTVDGKALEFDQEPVIREDHTLVPVRAIFEALGAEVSWLPAGQKIIANTADTNITMQIGKREYFVNGVKKKLDVAPQLIQDRTMVPARAISETLGAEVEWDAKTQTVVITTK